MWGPTQNFGPISSAVWTFIGYKHPDTQTDKQSKCNRLLGRFEPTFYFNWKHVLFVYIVKQKKSVGFWGFSKFNKNQILLEVNFLIFDHP